MSSVDHGEVRRIRGAPPEVVTRFCEAFARATPAVMARVGARREGGTTRLDFTGDMPAEE
jgi:hypothetical protein